jgi:arylsulfatase A-like enzyme
MPKSEKPNILIIWGDDIGWFNVTKPASARRPWPRAAARA